MKPNTDEQPFELLDLRVMRDVELALASLRRRLHDLYGNLPLHAHHGKSHGEDVEQHLSALLARIDIPVTLVEHLALLTSALLHDVGYTLRDGAWSYDSQEHIAASLDICDAMLCEVSVFADHSIARSIVSYLIAHHDDTNYQYPSLRRKGIVEPVNLGTHAQPLEQFEQTLTELQRRRLTFLLHLLQEADALTCIENRDIARTLENSSSQNLPTFGAGNPINAWCWEESRVGNVLLAAKRALVDAYSTEGQNATHNSYDESMHFVEALCREHGVPFKPETFMPFRESRNVDFKLGTDHVTIKSYLPWGAVEARLRNATLLVDRSLKPYASAKIELKHYDISELRPISTYVLNAGLAQLEHVQMELCLRYALSMFDLTGLLEYEFGNGQYRQGPPVVERYYEPAEEREVSVIVDGLHRIMLARKLGVRDIWAAEISDVPEQFPIVAFPLTWRSVRQVDGVPSNRAKRKFRYPSINDFPDVSSFTAVPVTPSNYLYFFYRDLSSLGSSGIRKSDVMES